MLTARFRKQNVKKQVAELQELNIHNHSRSKQ